MPRRKKSTGPKPHTFRNKLLLNQWLISCFGIDPLSTERKRPFHKLATLINNPSMEGLDNDNLYRFYHALKESDLFFSEAYSMTSEKLLTYEENIVHHTRPSMQKENVRWSGSIINGYLSCLWNSIWINILETKRSFFRNSMTL